MDTAAVYLARNIKQLRDSRGFSQERAAKMAGIPRATWSNLESGSANPTLTVLLRVASVLQVSLEEIIGRPKAEGKLIPAGELKTNRRGEATIRKILPDSLPGCELDRFELPPGGRLVGVPHRQGTREYLTCERGSLRIAIQGESADLSEGDVYVFRGDQRHSYFNPGKALAIGYSIVVLGADV